MLPYLTCAGAIVTFGLPTRHTAGRLPRVVVDMADKQADSGRDLGVDRETAETAEAVTSPFSDSSREREVFK